MSSIEPQDTDEFLVLFASRTVYQYMEVASVALFVYDYFITIDAETDLILNRPWNPSSVLFCVTRYLPLIESLVVLAEALAPNPSSATCAALLHSRVWLYTIGLFIAELILVLRTTAIWGGRKMIGTSLFIADVACLGAFAYNTQKFIDSLVFFSPSPNTATISGCIASAGSSRIWFSYLTLTIFETAVFLLTAFKAVYQKEWKGSPLLQVIFSDGIAMYGCALVLSIISILVVNFAPADASNAFHGLHRVLHAILAERLVLNIKRAMSDTSLDS